MNDLSREQDRISEEECAVILRELGDEAWGLCFNPHALKKGGGMQFVESYRRMKAEEANGTLKEVSPEELLRDLKG